MSSKESEAQALPTKDLFESYVVQRVSSRWAAFYLIATSTLILAWSRSPGWLFKMPFELFKNGKDDLTVSAGFAPVFGPLIEMFFYYNFFIINCECLRLGRFLLNRFKPLDKEVGLLQPPFEVDGKRLFESSATALLMLGTLAISFWILGDFFFLEFDGNQRVWSLLLPQRLSGVSPHHRGSEVNTLVYGLWQPWLYVTFMIFKIYVIAYVLADTWNYCRRSLNGGRPSASVWELLK